MLITQGQKYALRAIFELASQWPGPQLTKMAEIAQRQSIPGPFLEVLMARLRRGRLVVAKRGRDGGYGLRAAPDQVTVGDVFRALEGSRSRRRCLACGTNSREDCPMQGSCAFLPLWRDVEEAVFRVLDRTTIKDLLDRRHPAPGVPHPTRTR